MSDAVQSKDLVGRGFFGLFWFCICLLFGWGFLWVWVWGGVFFVPTSRALSEPW